MNECPTCGKESLEDATECVRCGRPFGVITTPDIASELLSSEIDGSILEPVLKVVTGRDHARYRTLVEALPAVSLRYEGEDEEEDDEVEAERTVGAAAAKEDLNQTLRIDTDTEPSFDTANATIRIDAAVVRTIRSNNASLHERAPTSADSSGSLPAAKIPLAGGVLGTGDVGKVESVIPGVSRQSKDLGRKTVVEGLRAITTEEGTESAGDAASVEYVPSLARAGRASATSTEVASQRVALVPPHRTRTGLLVLGIFAFLLVGGAALGGYWYLVNQQADGMGAPSPAPYRVRIPAGPYLSGLSNDFRLMFADTCKKLADDPKIECKEDIALRGETPQTEREVAEYLIDAYEVSNADWQACVEGSACPEPDLKACKNYTVQGLLPFLRIPKALRSASLPVVCVNQQEAAQYCEWVGGRLPSPDEWEKAARGPNANLFPWGSDWDPKMANWSERDILRTSVTGELDGFIHPAPVDSFESGRSAHGLYHQAGNVAEWVKAPGDSDKLEASARGGSWLSNPIELRATYRLWLSPDVRRTDVGFRCAANP